MRIQVALIMIVVLSPVTASFAGDHTPSDSGVGSVPSTMALPPERRSVPEKSSTPDDASRRKTMALLILMLKEGRGAR